VAWVTLGRARRLGLIAALLVAAEAPAPADDNATPTPVSATDDERPVAPPARRQFGVGMAQILRGVQSSSRTLVKQDSLTGNWGGLRHRLNGWGVIPNAAYFTDILGNPVGGEVGKVRYAHDIGVDLLVDFQRMFGLQGARFQVTMSSRAGNNLSDDIGNVMTVAEVCCQLTTRLVTLAFEQSLLEHRLDIRIGRLSTGDDFMSSPLYLLFVNAGLDANPFGPLLNVPYFAYPAAAWGARVRARPLTPLYVAAGVYNGDGRVARNGAHGVDFSFHDRGVLLTFEAGLEPGHHRMERLPGHYRVGGYYHTGRFRRFDAPADSDLPSAFEHGNGGYYFLVDQMVYREVGNQGLWPFAAVTLSPSEEINTMPLFAAGGLTYQGLIPGRDADTSIVGLFYGQFSRDLRRSQAGSPRGQQDFEMILEWAYIIELAAWLHVQPDFQYIFRPGGTGNIPDALVMGVQIGINL
jgi:porin